MRIAIRLTVVAVMIAAATTPSAGQKAATAADAAKQMSGAWTINLALSHAFAPSGGGPGRGRGGAAYAFAGAPFQRGGRGGGDASPAAGADLTPEELAERTVMRQIQQIP